MNVAQASGGELTSEELGHAVARKITRNSKYLECDELVVGKNMVRRRASRSISLAGGAFITLDS